MTAGNQQRASAENNPRGASAQNKPRGTSAGTELDLRVLSDWKEMGRVNQAVADFLHASGLSEEAVDRYTMVVCELVENGIKYGHFGKIGDAVLVHLLVRDGSFSVQVTNPVGTLSKSNLDVLDRTIQWVRGYQAPFEAFIARMKAISREPIDTDRSRLGLVRITYEGRAMLDFYMEENQMLSVSAVARVE